MVSFWGIAIAGRVIRRSLVPTIWKLNQYKRKEDGSHLVGFQMVRLSCFQMALKDFTIPTTFHHSKSRLNQYSDFLKIAIDGHVGNLHPSYHKKIMNMKHESEGKRKRHNIEGYCDFCKTRYINAKHWISLCPKFYIY